MSKPLLTIPFSLAILLFSCGEKVKTTQVKPSAGEKLWKANCAVCHQQGLGGAPMIGNNVQWKKRVEQGLPVLFQHAINGYSGATGEMPARGGNEELSDEQIKLAVTYMVEQLNIEK
jgi:cytochrome c5